MSLRELGPGRYQIRIYTGIEAGRRRYATKVVRGSRKDAELEKARMVLDAAAGRVVTAPNPGTVAELLTDWLRICGPSWSESTFDTNESVVRVHLIPGLGATRTAKLTTKQIQTFYAGLRRKGLAWRTVDRIHDVLRRALEVAWREWGEIASNPAVGAGPKVPAHEVHPPELGAALDLAGAAPRPWLVRAFVLAVSTGLRRGELCGLQIRDLDEAEAELVVRRRVVRSRVAEAGYVVKDLTKMDRPGRRVPLDPATLEMVAAQTAYMAARARECGGRLRPESFLFSHEAEGREPWDPNYVTRSFGRVRDRAGADGVRFHDLRHTYVSELLDAGVDEVAAAAVAGHSRPTTTLNVYGHLRTGANRKVAEAMGARLSAARPPTTGRTDVDNRR